MGNPRCGIAVLRYLPSSFSFSASPSTLFIKHSPPSHPSPVSPSFVFFVLFVCAFVIVILDRPETAICWYPDLLDLLDLLYWNAPRYQIVNVVSHANDDSLHSIFNIRCWCRWFGDASMCSFSSFLFFSVVFPFSSLPTCVFVCFHPESWVVPSVWISVVYITASVYRYECVAMTRTYSLFSFSPSSFSYFPHPCRSSRSPVFCYLLVLQFFDVACNRSNHY